MDNKNNRLFYWNVKDFINKKPEEFSSKRDSLKDSIQNILNENRVFTQSNYVNNPDVVDTVKNQIEYISEDENQYISKKYNKKVNSLSNPFNKNLLTEAPAAAKFKVYNPSLGSVFGSSTSSGEESGGYEGWRGALDRAAEMVGNIALGSGTSTGAAISAVIQSMRGTTGGKPTMTSLPPGTSGTVQYGPPSPELPPGTPGTVQYGPPSPDVDTTPKYDTTKSGATGSGGNGGTVYVPGPGGLPVPFLPAIPGMPGSTFSPPGLPGTVLPTVPGTPVMPPPAPPGATPSSAPSGSTSGSGGGGGPTTVGKPSGPRATTRKFPDEAYNSPCGNGIHLAQCAAIRRREASIAMNRIHGKRGADFSAAYDAGEEAKRLAREAEDAYQAWKVDWLEDATPAERRMLIDYERKIGYTVQRSF